MAEVDGYVGFLADDAAAVRYSERHLQRELTGEVEQWRQQQLQVRLDALHVHDRRRESFRAVKDSASSRPASRRSSTPWPSRGVTKRQIATCWTSGRVLPQCRSGSSGSA